MSTPPPAGAPTPRPRRAAALRDAGSRGLALAFGLIALLSCWLLVAAWGEPPLRTAARLVFVLVLLELASLAWRWPRLRPRRVRRRAHALLTVLARPEKQADYAETTPQVGLAASLLDDWDALRREEDLLPAGALSPAEVEALAAFGRVLDDHRETLRAAADRPVPALQEEPAWRQLGEAAADALRAFPDPDSTN